MTLSGYIAAFTTAVVSVTTMSTAVSAQPVFGQCCSRYDFPVTAAPRAIAAADVSGDGFPDLVLAGTAPVRSRSSAPWLRRRRRRPALPCAKTTRSAAGRLTSRSATSTATAGWIIAVANADSHAITLLFNLVNGIFGRRSDLPFAGNPRGIAIGDFNRDTIPDIVATKFMGTTVEVLYGAGDGTFPRRLALQAPSGAQGVDGWRLRQRRMGDFAVASTSGTVRVYRDVRDRCGHRGSQSIGYRLERHRRIGPRSGRPAGSRRRLDWQQHRPRALQSRVRVDRESANIPSRRPPVASRSPIWIAMPPAKSSSPVAPHRR